MDKQTNFNRWVLQFVDEFRASLHFNRHSTEGPFFLSTSNKPTKINGAKAPYLKLFVSREEAREVAQTWNTLYKEAAGLKVVVKRITCTIA